MRRRLPQLRGPPSTSPGQALDCVRLSPHTVQGDGDFAILRGRSIGLYGLHDFHGSWQKRSVRWRNRHRLWGPLRLAQGRLSTAFGFRLTSLRMTGIEARTGRPFDTCACNRVRGWGWRAVCPNPSLADRSVRPTSVQVEVADGFAGVGGFLGFANGFLEFLFQKIGSVFLVFERLTED